MAFDIVQAVFKNLKQPAGPRAHNDAIGRDDGGFAHNLYPSVKIAV